MEHQNFQDLTLKTSLIPGILKSCGQHPASPTYQDYHQELWTLLWQLWQQVRGDVPEFEKRAFTFGRSRLIDLLRKQQRQIIAAPLLPEMDTPTPFVESASLVAFLKTLTPNEKNLLAGILQGYTLTELTHLLHCSRTKLYRDLEKLRNKAREFFEVG